MCAGKPSHDFAAGSATRNPANRAHKSDELNQAAEGELAGFSPVLFEVKNTTGSLLAHYSVMKIGTLVTSRSISARGRSIYVKALKVSAR